MTEDRLNERHEIMEIIESLWSLWRDRRLWLGATIRGMKDECDCTGCQSTVRLLWRIISLKNTPAGMDGDIEVVESVRTQLWEAPLSTKHIGPSPLYHRVRF